MAFESGDVSKRTVTIVQIAKKQLRIELRENKLQTALREFLKKKYGASNVRQERPVSSTRENLCRADIVVRRGQARWVYEVKSGCDIRGCVRRALGQLLEYSYWPSNEEATKLIIVGEAENTLSAQNYLNLLRRRFQIPVEYRQFDLKLGRIVK
jgi:hypothetical protein